MLNEPVPLTYYCASVPEGVTEIGEGAFSNCSAGLFDNKDEGVLYRISFPSTLKKIGAYAFYNADIDLNLEFPESLESIGPFAFAEYNALSPEGQQGTVTFNKKLNHIGYAVFERNADLTFELDEQNESFLLEDNQLYSSSGDQKIPLFRSEDDPEHEEH
ncbi:leucine-rich repeat domain-containing protein [Allobaculum mucilyticum]|uniref:leucine-rich repeat domain-containing protein n=1 Tax=Allobaculum mucilyticum TaxID=2834459 RepID=UPI001E52744D|nr:leucine-rich repeat domain-containing protein [Allobaculum mucilyticum]UNT95445.1 leucine-rich repeat domain-containing protein [Allobaculum mucilyticum]